MLENREVRIFFFSGYSWSFRNALKKRNIIIEDVLDGVHPFALIGKTEDRMKPYLKDCSDLTTIVSIKKNFKKMLSRDKNVYENNYVKQPYGKEVAYRNETKYLVLNFICLVNDLYKVGDTLYSDVYPSNAFREAILKEKKIPFPFEKDFNWKYYSSLFADACMESYDSDHIIFIRTNPAIYYIKDHEIHMESRVTNEIAAQLREIEDDFIDRTHCHCINEFLCHSPASKNVFLSYPIVYERIADRVAGIIFDNKKYKEEFYHFSHPLIKRLCKRLTQEKANVLKKDFSDYDRGVSTEVYKHFLEGDGSRALDDLHKLKIFFGEDRYDLMTYVKERRGKSIDIRLVELYTEYFKLEISDVVAVFQIYKMLDNKSVLCKVVQNICNNSDCLPLLDMKKFISRNQEFLKNYTYLDEELKQELNFDLSKGMSCYPIRLSESDYIFLNPHDIENLMICIAWEHKPTEPVHVVDEMVCDIQEIDALSRDWTFYIKRAKAKKGSVPLYLLLKNKIEFQQSLVFLDYCDILKNENPIIALKDNKSKVSFGNYKCICNLEPLMDDNAKIFLISSGLTDQIQYYVLSKYIEKLSGCHVFYDDLFMILQSIFNGVEIGKFVVESREAFNKKRLSRILSQRLIWEFDCHKNLADFLFEKGWEDIVGVVNKNRANLMSKCSRFIMDSPTIRVSASKVLNYYCGLMMPGEYLGENFHPEEYIKFPEFEDEQNRKTQEEMLSCDAVVVHLRLGDYVTMGNAPDLEFFHKCLGNLKLIKEYSDLKFFVFSDDIPWCQTHEKDILGELSDAETVHYISHNKREHSYCDMKLMSLGKVIIASNSGFSFMAAAMSKRKEIYTCQNPWRMKSMKQLGFRNKYDLLK